MTNLHELKARIESIGKTKSITNAMHRIASSKLLSCQDLYNKYQLFKNDFSKSLNNVISLTKQSIYMRKSKNQKRLYFVISADRGLVGGYHQNLFKAFMDEVSEHDSSDIYVVAIGKKAFAFFKNKQFNLVNEYVISNHDRLEAINYEIYIKNIIDSFVNDFFGSINLFYTHFENTMKQYPVSEVLLPLEAKIDDESQTTGSFVLFEGPKELILEHMIFIFLQSRIFGSLVDAKMSEFSSRILAMRRATDNAKEALEKMNIKYNQARQHKITSDLLDISNAKL